MILGMGKIKMSKSIGNTITPQEIVKEYGRDYMRYYFAKLSKGDDFHYDPTEFSDIQKVLTILANVNNFVNQLQPEKEKTSIEDRWIESRFNSAAKEITE